MLKWFKDCKNIENVKATYRKLCFRYHPDIAGDGAESTMKEINSEYEKAFERFKNIHESTANDSGNNDSNSEKRYYNADETPEMFKDIINGLIHCDGVNIDLVGSWVWLTGNTFAHKDTIKGLGFKWANKKKAWYWHSGEFIKRRNSKMTLDEIKDKYGCQSFKTTAQLKLA